MTVQYSTALRNACLDLWETTIGAGGALHIFATAKPANCAAGDNGTALAVITLTGNWASDAASGSKSLTAALATTAAGTGTPLHYRAKTSGGTVVEQGDISADMTVSPSAITFVGQQVQLQTWTKTMPGA